MDDFDTHSLEESVKKVVIEEVSSVCSRQASDIKCEIVSVDDSEIKHVDAPEPEEVEVAGDDKAASSEQQQQLEQGSGSPEKKSGAEDDAAPKEGNQAGDESDTDSEDDLQVIVNDEDIFGPAPEGGEEVEGEEMFVEEHYEDVDWAAEMHYHHAQFYKYVRPGSGPEDPAQAPGSAAPGPFTPGSGPGPFPPGSMSGYGMGLWGYPFAYEFVLPASKTIFDIDLEQFEDKPWAYPGVDVSDYFNFGFTEETWKQYCEDFARARDEASTKTRMRDDENDQGWGYDNGGYNESSEPQKRGRMRSSFSSRVDGGMNDRRSSGEPRRNRRASVIQIPSHEGERDESHSDFRRRPRSDDLPRRKMFSSPGEQLSPLSGRLSRVPSGPPFSQSSSGRVTMYTARSRVSSPGRIQGSFSNGSRRHSTDSSSKPWRSSSRRSDEAYDDDEGSYGSSGQSDSGGESEYNESEDEYTRYRNHRLRRFSSQPLESRLGGRIEVSREAEPGAEKRTVKLSRHVREEESEPASNSRRLPEKLERSSASAQVATQRRSSELVTERRSSQGVKRIDQAVRETISTEVKAPRVAPAGSRLQRAVEAEPKQPEKKQQSISERRAQLVAEKRAEKLLAEKREREAKAENREREAKEREAKEREAKAEHRERNPKAESRERNPNRDRESNREREAKAENREARVERSERGASSQVRGKERTSLVVSSVVEKRLVKPAIRAAQQSAKASVRSRTEQASTKPDNGDLRLKVLERVSARWKFHLRMDDEHAKKKRENLIKPARRQEEASSEDASMYEAGERVDSKRRLHREADEVYEGGEYDEVEERWEMSGGDRKRKRAQRYAEEEEEEWEYSRGEAGDGFVSRSQYRHRYEEQEGDEGWEIEEGECEEDQRFSEEERWNEYEQEEAPELTRRKRRKFDYGVSKDSNDGYEEEPRRGIFYDGSTSSGPGEEMVYNRKRGVKSSYSRETDRWTGTLYDSGEEYDE